MSVIPAYIVCSPFPRCGLSTATRLLVDYHVLENRPFVLFDTDIHSRVLENWFPEVCNTIDLGTTRGQMALFDQLVAPREATRIVEVCAPSYRQFFAQAREIGIFEEAERHGLMPTVLFASSGSYVAVEAAATLHALWRNVPMITVANEGFVRLGQKLLDHLAAFPTHRSFQIPRLEELQKQLLEEKGFSLSDFYRAPPEDMSLVVRADLRSWMKRIFTQFHAHELRTAFERSRYLMRA